MFVFMKGNDSTMLVDSCRLRVLCIYGELESLLLGVLVVFTLRIGVIPMNLPILVCYILTFHQR